MMINIEHLNLVGEITEMILKAKECIHCNGKGFNGLDTCTQCNGKGVSR